MVVSSRPTRQLGEENHHAPDRRDQRRGEDAELRLRAQERGLEGQLRDEEGHGEAHATEAGGAIEIAPVHALGQRGPAALHREPAEQRDPDLLPEDQAQDHPEADGLHQGLGDAALDAHSRVEEGEQRQDEEHHERVEPLLELEPRRLHVLGGAAQVRDGIELRPVVDHAVPGQVALPQGLELLPHHGEEVLRVPARLHRHQHGEEHAGHGGVHAGEEDVDPHPDGQDQVDHGVADAEALGDDDQDQEAQRQGELGEVQVPRVEDGDDQDRPQVVGDGQGGEEHLEPDGHPLAEERQHPQGEGDVRGHGHAPAPGRLPAGVEEEEEERRRDHPAQGRRHRQDRLVEGGQPAHHHLPLDLEPDDEEEDRHQEVVDPVVQRHRVVVLADLEAQLDVEQMEVGLGPGRVRPGQGHQGAGQQDDAARHLRVDEAGEGSAAVVLVGHRCYLPCCAPGSRSPRATNRDDTMGAESPARPRMPRSQQLRSALTLARYRRLILLGRVTVPLEQARRLVGPDCAYHLYFRHADRPDSPEEPRTPRRRSRRRHK